MNATQKPMMSNSDSAGSYQERYQTSIEDNEAFWSEQAKTLLWRKPFSRVKDVSFAKDDVHIRWFDDGELNVCENCVDRHLESHADKTAIIWQGDDRDQSRYISYRELHSEVCKLANALESIGIEQGDRVILYMPMVPEAAYAMLACARIGAIHSAVFGGFSANALADRINDCSAKLVITATVGQRGNKFIPLKNTVDEAITEHSTPTIEHVLVVEHHSTHPLDISSSNKDISYQALVSRQAYKHEAKAFNAEHPLFVLYTSGSTGKPKGLQHSSGGYLCYAESTFRHAFDYQDDDVFWCSADVGWITGHSYLIYGPLSAGATTLMFEGVPNSPNLGRFAEVIDQHKVSLFYTAPTAIRMLMTNTDEALNGGERSTLRIAGTVGEPINPEVWRWYHDEFAGGHADIVDTWWQTETGGHMILPLPSKDGPPKPGAASQPFFGIQPALVDANGDILDGPSSGHLVILDSWPGQGRTIWGDHQRFVDTYFSTYEGMYFSGDGARRDEDGDYWITGRVDDVLNVSGHRLGTAEVESAAVAHEKVVEAAVVGYPHDLKGEAIYIYVIPAADVAVDDQLSTSLRDRIRKELGPIANPDKIQWVRDLPKTRSGKIMRRILRKVASNELESLGDTSTLADPSVVESLIEGRLNK
jgi:acetyl-CoA synthetase